MGIAERVERMLVRVETPSRNVSAELLGRDDLRISFAPGFYQRADRVEMQAQLAQVARLLWAAWSRHYDLILSDEYGGLIEKRRPESERDVTFDEQRDQLIAHGSSPDGRILVDVRGMRDWKVSVAADAMRVLRESEFGAGVAAAARELVADQQLKILQLKVHVYDPRLRERLNR